VTTTPPSKPAPRPGQPWTLSDALVSLLADTPVTVTAVRANIVHFTTASAMPMRMPVQMFTGMLDPVPM